MPSDPTKPVSLVRALTAEERAKAEQRLELVTRSLDHRDPRSLERSVVGMLLSFPSGRATGEEARAVAAAYVNALSDLPPWAVNEAARRWTRGQAGAGNPAFPPSSAELYDVASRIVSEFRFEAASLERMLAGAPETQPVPKMSRERIAAIAEDTKRAMAKASLDAKAAALGLDPVKTMAGIDNAKPGPSTFSQPQFDPLGR